MWIYIFKIADNFVASGGIFSVNSESTVVCSSCTFQNNIGLRGKINSD